MPFGLIDVALRWRPQYSREVGALKGNSWFWVAMLLSVSRIALAPLCVILIFHHRLGLAAVVYGVGFFTDGVDGAVARRHSVSTSFGKRLDPICSSILANSTILALVIAEPNLRNWLLPCWVICGLTTQLAGGLSRITGGVLGLVVRGLAMAAGFLGLDFGTLLILCVQAAGWEFAVVAVLTTAAVSICLGKHRVKLKAAREAIAKLTGNVKEQR